jgi:hypothetical protein
MPTKKEREYYRMGFSDGYKSADVYKEAYDIESGIGRRFPPKQSRGLSTIKPKRKTSDWIKFIKANSKKKKYKFANGKLKLKTMGIAYRKTAAYKRNKKK